MPKRVKVAGDLFHGRVPDNAVYVGRGAPGLPASPYANPFSVKRYGREESQRRFREYVAASPELVERARRELAGRDLACWCGPDDWCHGDDWLPIVNSEAAHV